MENQKEMEQSEIVKMFNSMGFFCGEEEELIKRLEEQEDCERMINSVKTQSAK